MNSPSSTGAIGLAVAGLLIGAGGVLHPRVDTSLEFDQGLAGMFESSAWSLSHLLTMAGFVVARRVARDVGDRTSLRVLGRIAAVGAAFAALESVPHLLAASEASLHGAMPPTPHDAAGRVDARWSGSRWPRSRSSAPAAASSTPAGS